MRLESCAFVLLVCAGLTACGAPVGGGAPAATAPAATTLADAKIAPALAAAARRLAAGEAPSDHRIRVNHRGQIEVYVHVKRVAPAVASALIAAGAHIELASPTLGVYQAWADPPTLARLTAISDVTRISLPAYGVPRQPDGGRMPRLRE